MQLFRFLLLATTCFAGGFFGLNWLRSGGPLPLPYIAAKRIESNAALPTFSQAEERAKQDRWGNMQTLQGNKDPERDKLRLEVLQAANAYTQSSCDRTMKANLVAALSAYAGAWADKSGCKPFPCGGSARVELAAKMFSGPLDLRIRDAVYDAFSQGGVSVDDFHRTLSLHVAMIAGHRGDAESACSPTRSSASRKR